MKKKEKRKRKTITETCFGLLSFNIILIILIRFDLKHLYSNGSSQNWQPLPLHLTKLNEHKSFLFRFLITIFSTRFLWLYIYEFIYFCFLFFTLTTLIRNCFSLIETLYTQTRRSVFLLYNLYRNDSSIKFSHTN